MGSFFLPNVDRDTHASFLDEHDENGGRLSEQKEPRRGILFLACLRFDVQSCTTTGAFLSHQTPISERFCRSVGARVVSGA